MQFALSFLPLLTHSLDKLIDLIMSQAKIPLLKTSKSNRNRLLKWIDVDPALRPYRFWGKERLEEELNRRKVLFKKGSNVEDLCWKLANNDNGSDVAESGNENEASTTIDGILSKILEWAFLRPEKRKGDRDARSIGIKNESRMTKGFWDDHADPNNQNKIALLGKILGIYSVGMVAKKGKPHVKSSMDGLVLCKEDGKEPRAVPLEIKTRVSVEQVQEAEAVAAKNVGVEYMIGDVVYGSCNSESIAYWIPSSQERIQILHHAYACKATEVVFLVGHNKRLIYGVQVKFDGALLDSYGDIMDFLYDSYFASFYSEANIMPTSKVSTILESCAMSK